MANIGPFALLKLIWVIQVFEDDPFPSLIGRLIGFDPDIRYKIIRIKIN